MFGFFSSNEPVGLIAGAGDFPMVVAEAAQSMSRPLILFGIEGHTDNRLRALASQSYFVNIGALGELLAHLKKTKIKKVVLAGSVPKKELYNPSLYLDDAAREIVSGTKNKGDDHILRAFSFFLKAKCGVSVIDSRIFLKKILAPRGVLTKSKPSKAEKEDLRFGYKIAKQIGRLDIGQTVVVKNGIVLAVEALEGTDKAIKRGGELGNGGSVVVKVTKPNQDLRFDLPCVGFQTLESLKEGRSRVLGIEAGKTIMLYKDKLIEKANEENITLVGL